LLIQSLRNLQLSQGLCTTATRAILSYRIKNKANLEDNSYG